MKLNLTTVLFAIPFLLISTYSAVAIDAQIYRPLNPSQGGFSLYSGSAFVKNRFSMGLYYNFDKHPLEFGDASSNKIDDLVNDLHSANLVLTYELSKWVALNVDLPYHFLSDFEPIQSTVRTAEEIFGDVSVSLPVFLGCTAGQLCFKVIPQALFDSGEESDFVGLAKPAYGLDLAIDKTFKSTKFVFNAGYRSREEEQVFNLSLDDAVTLGLGLIQDIGKPNGFMLIGEIKAELANGEVEQETVNSPAEAFGGLRYLSCKKRMVANLGYSKGLNKGYGSPDYRIFAGLSYALGGKPQSGCEFMQPKNTQIEVLEPPVVVVKQEKSVKKEKIIFSKVKPVVIRLKKINFYSASDRIIPKSIATLIELRKILVANPEIKELSVEGHTDSAGSRSYNTNLSFKRAEAVHKILIAMRINPERLKVRGFGPDRPIADNSTEVGRAKNRRVEFVPTRVEGGSLKILIE